MRSEDASAAKELVKTTASRIKQERELRGWTQAEVAERVGSTRINVSRWENGTTIPGPYYRQRLSDLFGKSVQELGLLHTNSEDGLEDAAIFSDHLRSHISPFWYIPHRPNPFFTGREEILQRLQTEFRNRQTPCVILALSGLGGVGKTQIAIEYAYNAREDYQAVFWLNASTHDALSIDLVAIASLLDLPEKQERGEVVTEAVKRWLATHKGWLLILDNVDVLETVLDFLPLYSTGDVLITTRMQVLSTIAHSIVVENMTQQEGVTFLLHRAKLSMSRSPLDECAEESCLQAARIVDELGGLPLALDQAGAYIEETHCGLSQYVQRYDTHRKELLLRRGSFPLDHPDSVATTWQLSFKEIEEKSAASAELLYLCAFLDADSIPEDLFIAGASKLGPLLSKTVGDPLKLDKVLEPLHLYSLIRRLPEIGSLTIHRLVQAVLRQDLSLTQQKRWARRVIRALNHVFPEVNITTWNRCQQLLPQVQVCVQFFDQYSFFLPELGHLFQRAGDYAFSYALYDRAEVFFQRAVVIYEQVFSPEHAYTATSLHHLGELYRVWGRYKEAESLFLRALAIYEQSLPQDYFNIASVLNNLGELYHNLERYDEAEPLFLRALSITERVGGPDHHATLTTLHHLARLYHFEGRYKEAEQIFSQVLDAQKQVLSSNELDIAITLNNLAILYRAQGHLEQAKDLLLRSLEIEENLLGPNDPHIATALQNLGIVYQRLKQYKEAEAFLQRALTIKETTLGSGHLSTAKTMTNLAYLYKVQKRYSQAKTLFQKALTSGLGQEHPYTAVILRNLARLYHEEENYEEAESLYQRALAISEKNLPAARSNMKRVLESLAELYRTLGRKEEAVRVEQQKLAL